jgi:hypothetical protein
MCLRIVIIFLTLVGSVVWANPHTDAPTKVSAEEAGQIVVDEQKLENISVTPAPAKRATLDDFITHYNRKNYYYPYRQELALFVGAIFSIKDSFEDSESYHGLLGFSYLLPSQFSPKWEFAAALATVGDGLISFSRRSIYNEKGAFRPYFEIGLTNKLVPDEKFATFSNWDNYLVRFALGLADIRQPPRSAQLELEIAAGADDILVLFTYGAAWGF